MEAWENKLQKLQISQLKWNLVHDNFTCAFSVPLKFEICLLGSHKEIVSGVITDN